MAHHFTFYVEWNAFVSENREGKTTFVVKCNRNKREKCVCVHKKSASCGCCWCWWCFFFSSFCATIQSMCCVCGNNFFALLLLCVCCFISIFCCLWLSCFSHSNFEHVGSSFCVNATQIVATKVTWDQEQARNIHTVECCLFRAATATTWQIHEMKWNIPKKRSNKHSDSSNYDNNN